MISTYPSSTMFCHIPIGFVCRNLIRWGSYFVNMADRWTFCIVLPLCGELIFDCKFENRAWKLKSARLTIFELRVMLRNFYETRTTVTGRAFGCIAIRNVYWKDETETWIWTRRVLTRDAFSNNNHFLYRLNLNSQGICIFLDRCSSLSQMALQH